MEGNSLLVKTTLVATRPWFNPKPSKRKTYALGVPYPRLASLISQAFDLRETPYLVDASEAIADEFQRLRLERRDAENRWLEGLGI